MPETRTVDSLQGVLESNVKTLQGVVGDLETTIERVDGETALARDDVSDESAQWRSSAGRKASFDISEILATSDQTRLVIADFDTALKLMDENQAGLQRKLKLIITNDIAEQLSDRFPLNSYFQKLEDRDGIEIRQESSDSSLSAIVHAEDRFYYPLSFGSVQTYVEISNSQLHQRIEEEFDEIFNKSENLNLAVPSWKELLEGLAEATSSSTAAEFESLVEAATPENLDSLDEISLALIAAARTGALQYDISNWGEEVNIGSKATFSRRKSSLVDDGIITTESVQMDIGRPRDRLLIPDESSEVGERSSGPQSKKNKSGLAEDQTQNDRDGEDVSGDDDEKLEDMVDELLQDILLDRES